MKVWVPVMHFGHTSDEGEKECAERAFTPHLEFESLAEFWAARELGIEVTMRIFEITHYELRAAAMECDHINFTDECRVCEMWLNATLAKSIIDGREEEESAHSD